MRQGRAGIDFYTSVFPDSAVGSIDRYGPGEEPDPEGNVKFSAFTLAGQSFGAMESAHAHQFGFNEAISLLVSCDSQQEIDRHWASLSAVPEAEQCGWLKDRYGVSWQIAPSEMDDMMRTGTDEQIARVTETPPRYEGAAASARTDVVRPALGPLLPRSATEEPSCGPVPGTVVASEVARTMA
ncbi:MAG: VOC family protein [Actinomycetota bacterium]